VHVDRVKQPGLSDITCAACDVFQCSTTGPEDVLVPSPLFARTSQRHCQRRWGPIARKSYRIASHCVADSH
jgi:hypothetical protein